MHQIRVLGFAALPLLTLGITSPAAQAFPLSSASLEWNLPSYTTSAAFRTEAQKAVHREKLARKRARSRTPSEKNGTN